MPHDAITDAASAIEAAAKVAETLAENNAQGRDVFDHENEYWAHRAGAAQTIANKIRALPIAPAQADPGVESQELLKSLANWRDNMQRYYDIAERVGEGDPGFLRASAVYEEARTYITAALARPANGDLVAALEKCRERFREYEAHHRAKVAGKRHPHEHGAPMWTMAECEAAAKADRNREMAELCDRALGAGGGE